MEKKNVVVIIGKFLVKILNVKFVVLVVMDQIIEINIDADYTADMKDIKLVLVLKLAIIKNVFV
jgi:hypothetical protein